MQPTFPLPSDTPMRWRAFRRLLPLHKPMRSGKSRYLTSPWCKKTYSGQLLRVEWFTPIKPARNRNLNQGPTELPCNACSRPPKRQQPNPRAADRRYDAALATLERIPEPAAPRLQAAIAHLRASTLLRAGRATEAIAAFADARALSPTDIALCRCLDSQERISGAPRV
jgi:hypothetical protein